MQKVDASGRKGRWKIWKGRFLFSYHSLLKSIMMQPDEQEPEEQTTIKKGAALDSIPEDVALLIVEVMKGWVLKGKSVKKEQATK